jgi:phosphoribosyl 1,2-cyclic phosphodiesterase
MTTIRFWGVRGSIAAAGSATAQVGGNTSCVEVRAGDRVIILDAGTGLRALGAHLAGRGPVEADLLLSHFHWDHIQGFPFFGPAYAPSSKLTIHGGTEGGDVRAQLAAQMRAPHFPVGLEAMRAQLAFTGVAPGAAFEIGDALVRTAAARHPNGCLAYRIDHGGRSLVYATDTEHDAVSGRIDPNLVTLAAGADLLIYDAQYTPDEYSGAAGGGSKVGWGHSTAQEGARIARAAGVSRLVLFHHDPAHDDWQIARIEAETRAFFPRTVAAREGLTIDLAEASRAKSAA